jgi:hypothetical protein
MEGCSAGATISCPKTRARDHDLLLRRDEKRKMNKVPLIDGHAHLEELEDLSESLQEAKASGNHSRSYYGKCFTVLPNSI